jgi:hypothetical protein
LTIEHCGWTQPAISADGTYTFLTYCRTNDTTLYLTANSTFDGSIDDVSAKELVAYKY